MEILRKLLATYMIAVAVAVAVWFIINSFLVDSFSVTNVWDVLNVLMIIGLVLALIFNYERKWKEGRRDPGEAVSRRYIEVNAVFYLTAGVTILFLHNWFSLLALGDERSLGSGTDLNHQAWVIWAVVDTLLPLTLGVTGCAVWRESSSEGE